jgi:Flp pilus assembly protein TadB
MGKLLSSLKTAVMGTEQQREARKQQRTRREAEQLKQRQEEYEAYQKGRRKERVRQAYKRGRQSAQPRKSGGGGPLAPIAMFSRGLDAIAGESSGGGLFGYGPQRKHKQPHHKKKGKKITVYVK